MFDPNKIYSKEEIKAIIEQESFYSSTLKEEKEKSKPEELSYEEKLLLKHSLPVAYFLYVLRALGYVLLAIFAITIIVAIAVFWYGYIPHSINMFLFDKFPQIFAAGLDLDHYFDNGLLILVISWAVKDMALWFLYDSLTTNLDRVNKIKEENKELFND